MRLNNNDSFVQGTVQGAQWYTLLGGMQVRQGLHLHLKLACRLPEAMKQHVHPLGAAGSTAWLYQPASTIIASAIPLGSLTVSFDALHAAIIHCTGWCSNKPWLIQPMPLRTAMQRSRCPAEIQLCVMLLPVGVTRTGCTLIVTAWS